MKALTKGTLGVALCLVLTACGKDRSEQPRTSADARESGMQPASRSVTGEPSQPATSVPNAIAEARCAVEERCENIGDQEKYTSIENCLTQMKDEWKDEISERACPNGTERMNLDRCVIEIRASECNDASSALDGYPACSVEELCNPALK